MSKLCMFRPLDRPLERGWVGRLDGDHVVQLAAQTIQSFFTGGGGAREHAVYRLDQVRLLAPVLHPPAVRVFEDQDTFAFANPAAICGPDATAAVSQGGLTLLPRLAAVVGADEELAGYTAFAEWRRPGVQPPKDRDFALGLGPLVVTPDELVPSGLEAAVRSDGQERLRGRFEGFDWSAAHDLAAEGTRLRAGDLLAGLALGSVGVEVTASVELEVDTIGVLTQAVGS